MRWTRSLPNSVQRGESRSSPRVVPAFARIRGDDARLRLQYRRAGGGPAFQIGVGARRIFQRIGVVDRHVQFAVDNGGKQRVGALQQFGALADVVVEFRSGRKQRAVVVEFGDRKR